MEKETLKSLRAKAKLLRSKVSSAPLSKATPDQLRSEINMLERAVKADEKALAKKAEKASMEAEKKKTTSPPVKAVTVAKAPAKKVLAISTVDEREKELLKREKELAKKEKKLLSYTPPKETMFRPGMKSQMQLETGEDTSDSEDY
jgi:enterochelin esterase-like enzyme